MWIPTGQQLPPDKTPVLAVFNGEHRILERRWEHPGFEYTYQAFWHWDDPTDDGQLIDNAEVTYWMALPALPGAASTLQPVDDTTNLNERPTMCSTHPIPWALEQGVNGGVNIVDANGETVVDTGTDGGMSGEAACAMLTAVNAPLTAKITVLKRRVAELEESLIKAAERESRLIKGKLQNDYRPYPTVAT